MMNPRSLFVGAMVAIAGSSGCVSVQRMPLSKSAASDANDVHGEITTVAASTSFLAQRQESNGSILGVTLHLTRQAGSATPATTTLVDLEHASLIVADPVSGGESLTETLTPIAGGTGNIPTIVNFNDRPYPISLDPGELRTVWIAFRARQPFDERDVPRRIVLRVPVSTSEVPLQVVIAEPSTGRPRWVHPPIANATYAGVSAMGTPFDEASMGIVRSSSRHLVREHVVLGPSFYFGIRGGELRGEREKTIVCCDLGLSLDAWFPFSGKSAAFGPWVSYQSVFALEHGRADKATWHGPAAGIQFSSRLIEPIVAGALPVRATPSPLGYSSFTIAYVHLFRRGDTGGSPAALVTFEHTLPEW